MRGRIMSRLHTMSRITHTVVSKALNSVRNRRALEPSPWAAAYHWFHGDHLVGPPAIAKQRHLLKELKSRGHRIFIEAGTYKGETTAFFVPHVYRVISVELDDSLFAAAERRFAENPNVTLVHGDSLVEIPSLSRNVRTHHLCISMGTSPVRAPPRVRRWSQRSRRSDGSPT